MKGLQGRAISHLFPPYPHWSTFGLHLPQKPYYFHRIFDQISKEKGKYSNYIVDSVTGMLELWKDENSIQDFYTHTCPLLFDMKTIAIWVLDKHVHSQSFKANLEHIGQVVIDLRRTDHKLYLQVKKAVERYNSGTYVEKEYKIEKGRIKLT